MKKAGHLIILISHKLDEIMDLCDRVTVLQKGQIVGHADTAEVDKKTLARMMVGRDVIFDIQRDKMPPSSRVLQVADVMVDSDKGYPAVKGVSFDIHRNEIFGIAGVSGNGQRELVEAITGLRKLVSGKIMVNDRDITNQSPRKIYNSGVSHVPEERIKFGIAPGLYLYENSILKQHHLEQYSKNSLLAYGSIKSHAKSLVDAFQVLAPSIHVQTKDLSGRKYSKTDPGTGNQP